MHLNKKIASTALGFLMVGTNAVGAENPKQGNATYFGSGYAERAPEYGEVTFTINVECLKSAEEVRKAIDAASAPIWKEIAANVTTFTETDRKYWGDIVASEGPDSYLSSYTTDEEGKVTSAPAKRLSTCENKELPLNTPVGSVFSGSQRIGVRTSKLDWVDDLVKASQKKAHGSLRTDAQVSNSSVAYRVTEATDNLLTVEVKRQARERATGAGSVFESDKKALKFESAHFLGSREGGPDSFQQEQMGSPIEKGKAPKVFVHLPLIYTVYAESADRVDATNSRGVAPLTSEYEAQGSSTAQADYAQITLTVKAECLTSKDKAADSIKAQVLDLTKQLEALQAGKQATETDRIVIGAGAGPQNQYPYLPIKWKNASTNRNRTGVEVVEYLDKCTGKTVAAPVSGNLHDLPGYWLNARSLQAKSSDFDGILKLSETLTAKYGVSSPDLTVAKITASHPTPRLTKASLQKLLVAARENATSCVLNPAGALADDAVAQGFKCAHVKSVRIGVNRNDAQLEALSDSMAKSTARSLAAPAAPGGGRAPQDLDIVEEKRNNDTRPPITKQGSYAFDFQFVTKDYVPLLKSVSTPMP